MSDDDSESNTEPPAKPQPSTGPVDWNETREAMRERIRASQNGSDWRETLRNDIRATPKATSDPPERTIDDGVLDPREFFADPPPYEWGQLPPIFEVYVKHKIASWGGSPAPYACGFAAMHASVLHSSVKVQTNPLEPDTYRNPNDFFVGVGKTGEKKSGLWRDLTSHQRKWQAAMSKAHATSKAKGIPAMVFLQNASVEGMMSQIVDNKGERLCVGSEEAMDFYQGAGAHRGEDGVRAMSNAVCATYDGGIYSKRLVNKLITVPEALATLIAVTVDENIVAWKSFQTMIGTGLMGRHTFGIVDDTQPRSGDDLIEGAQQAMDELMVKMRGLRDVRLVLSPQAGERWLSYSERRERKNTAMANDGESKGLVGWCKKFELRVMSVAAILQLYQFIEGGMQDFEAITVQVSPEGPQQGGGADKSSTMTIKRIVISEETLVQAATFVDGFLLQTQAAFYKVAEGQNEFSKELVNWLAGRVVNDDPNDPHGRELSRGALTASGGPSSLRGRPTDERKEQWRRWIRTLLDYGFIEPWAHPNERTARTRTKSEDELPWYKLRAEVFTRFGDDESMAWLRAHDSGVKAAMAKRGLGPGRHGVGI